MIKYVVTITRTAASPGSGDYRVIGVPQRKSFPTEPDARDFIADEYKGKRRRPVDLGIVFDDARPSSWVYCYRCRYAAVPKQRGEARVWKHRNQRDWVGLRKVEETVLDF